MSTKLDMKFNAGAFRDTVMNFIVPLVCFGLSAAMIFFVIYPDFKEIPQQKSILNKKTDLKNQLQSKITTLNKLSDYKSVVDEDLALTNKLLVSEDDVPYLLNQVDLLSRNSGLKVLRLNYGIGGTSELEEGDKATNFVAVNLGIEGTNDQLITFLQNTEKAGRLLEVTNFRYGSQNNPQAEAGVLSVTCLLYSPYMDVNAKATTDDPINVDISSPDFVKTINYIKGFTYYENASSLIPSVAQEKPFSEVTNESEKATETTQSTKTPSL